MGNVKTFEEEGGHGHGWGKGERTLQRRKGGEGAPLFNNPQQRGDKEREIMESASGSFLLLITSALILFRPKDVPIVARNAGRLVGLTIRGLKRGRDFVDEAIKQSTQPSSKNSDLSNVSEQLKSSYSIVSELASSVRRDMVDMPTTPASFIRSRFRAVTSAEPSSNTNGSIQSDKHPSLRKPQSQVDVESPQPSAGTSEQSPSLLSSPTKAETTPAAGADFIARCIEEAALAKQQQKIFPSSYQQDR